MINKMSARNLDGRKAKFSQKVWDLMGKDKAGWTLESVEPPAEVQENLAAKAAQKEKPDNAALVKQSPAKPKKRGTKTAHNERLNHD